MVSHQHLGQADYGEYHRMHSDSAVFGMTEQAPIIKGVAVWLQLIVSIFRHRPFASEFAC